MNERSRTRRKTREDGETADRLAWRAAHAAGGGALLLLGSLTLLVWAAGRPEYLQIDSRLPPLHYNAALGFIVWGIGYGALAFSCFRLARGAVGVLAALALLLLAAQFAPEHFGLDRWWFQPPASSPQHPLTGVPPTMIFGLGMAAAAIGLAARRDPSPMNALFGTLIGLVLAIGSPIALGAAQLGIVSLKSPGLSVLGAAAATLAGLIHLTTVIRKGIPAFAIGPALPHLVGAGGVLVTFLLWVSLNAEQNRRLERQVQFVAANVYRQAEERLPAELAELSDLSDRWTRTDRDRMTEQIDTFVANRPSCLGVARIEPPGTLTWVEARQKAPATLPDLGLEAAVVPALREGRVAVVRPPRSSWNGIRVVAIFAPDRRPAPEGGGLLAVYRLQELFDNSINPNVAPGYAIAIDDSGEPLFGRNTADDELRDKWNQSLPVHFQGQVWGLTVWPTRDGFQRESFSLPKFALLIGLLTTSLLTLSLHLARMARRRAAELEKEVREREQAQLARTQSETKYRSLIENLGQGVFLLDREFRYAAANQTFCRSVGRGESEVVGATDADLFDAGRAEKNRDEFRTVLDEGKSIESEDEGDGEGRKKFIRRVLTPVRGDDGRITGVLGICWDVTEQRLLEAHVHQASKMDAIGQLAGGIAHDFNNLLTAIIGNLDLILDDVETRSETLELASAAHNAASRAASLTQRLLGFSRRHKLDWVAADANTIVNEVLGLLRRTIDPLIRIETRLADDLWPVQADPAQLNQVLMNLCLNARDAMPGGGAIVIETACLAAADLPLLGGVKNWAGDCVRLRVSDSGIGMTDDVKARIYEPFFTTKEVGKGTGLGLPMVFGIVRQHKGWINCWSEVGRGTRFDIYLPRGPAMSPGASGSFTPARKRTGMETILLVDDEEMIRRVAALALKAQGYTVLEAADGQEAVDLYAREGDRISLVLLDLTMPALSGHEAFRHLVQLNSRVKVIFASGYAEEHLSDFEKEMTAGFLKKPYRPGDLIAIVDQALQSPKGGSRPIPRPAPRVEFAAYV